MTKVNDLARINKAVKGADIRKQKTQIEEYVRDVNPHVKDFQYIGPKDAVPARFIANRCRIRYDEKYKVTRVNFG